MAPHFPTVTQKDLKDTQGDKSCSICCDDYNNHGHIPIRTPCQHIFGRQCLASWLARNTTCPMCRANIGESDTLADFSMRYSQASERRQASRRDEPSTRPRAGTEASRAEERSSRYPPSILGSRREETSTRSRAGTVVSKGSGAPASRLSVSSSQWDETHLPTSSSSHRSGHTSRTAREAPPSSSSYRSSYTSDSTRAPPSSPSSRTEPNPIATLVSLLQSSRPPSHTRSSRHSSNRHAYPPFTRERLMELVTPGYFWRCSREECDVVAEQLAESDARERRGEPVFEPAARVGSSHSTRESGRGCSRLARPSNSRVSTIREEAEEYGSRDSERTVRPSHLSRSVRFADSREGGRESSSRHTGNSSRSTQSSTSSRAASRQAALRNMSDAELEDAIGRLRI